MAQLLWLAIILSIIACVYLAGGVFLRVFLKSNGYTGEDRGLKRYKGKQSLSIVFEPSDRYKEFISQYILSEDGGVKSLVCKRGKADFCELNFDIIAYGSDDRVLTTLNVIDSVDRTGFTKAVRVPPKTSYVFVKVNSYDGIELGDKEADDTAKKTYSNKFVLYFLCVAALFVLEQFIIRLCLSTIYGGVFKNGFLFGGIHILIMSAIAIATALICTICAHFYIEHLKKKNGGKA